MPDSSRPKLHVVPAGETAKEREEPLSEAEAERMWARNRKEPIKPPSPEEIRTMLQGREPPGRRLGGLPVRGKVVAPRMERKPEARLAVARRRR